jgi:hypothetical protein
MTDIRWSWFDGLLKRFSMPYTIAAILIGIIIYFIYLFLGLMMHIPYYLEEKIGFLLMGILIAYQLSGIQYLLDEFKKITSNICILRPDIEESFSRKARNRFADSIWRYLLLIVVVIPFYLVDWISPEFTVRENYSLMKQFMPNYSSKATIWIISFDIYHSLLGLLALILLSCILWIILNIAWTLRYASHDFYGNPLNINVFSINSRLRPVRSSVLMISFYYFVCISLLIFSYGLPGYILEKVILSAFLLTGLIFFFVGYESLYDITRDQIELEVDKISKKTLEFQQELLSLQSGGDYGLKIQETNFISSMLDALQKQRDAVAKAKTKVYSFRAIVSFIAAFFLPILTDVVKNDIVKKNLTAIIQSGDLVNQGLSMISSLYHKII